MTRVAGFTSNTVPWEILRAAGYTPRLLEVEDDSCSTPFADQLMEDVFDPRIRRIFDRLCGGIWRDLEMVVIPRTSEQEHKLYLYLREASRLQYSSAIPNLYLFNLLKTTAPESYDYGLDRTRQMAGDFKVAEGSLREAIAESNRARGCVRDILRCRQEGILEGSAAIPLIRRFYLEDRTIFADRVSAQLTGLRLPIATGRPRILIMGVLRGDATLHRIVEEAGGYVVAEDDWRSSRAAGDRDVCTEMDPVAAIFEKYFHDEVSPRIQSADGRDSWFQQEIGRNRIDGVLFHVPLEDDVAGWDQPRQARWLEGQAVPSLLVRKTDDSAIAAFIRRLLRR